MSSHKLTASSFPPSSLPPILSFPADGLRLNRGPLLAARDEDVPRAGNAAVAGITQELMGMNVKDLHTEEAKNLREARDLEDVLFS